MNKLSGLVRAEDVSQRLVRAQTRDAIGSEMKAAEGSPGEWSAALGRQRLYPWLAFSSPKCHISKTSVRSLMLELSGQASGRIWKRRCFDNLPVFYVSFNDIEDWMRLRFFDAFYCPVPACVSRPQLPLQMIPLV